ncbi:MAG: hypothetical protein ACKOFY_00845 [Candidatus Limnocylindrus sp.]
MSDKKRNWDPDEVIPRPQTPNRRDEFPLIDEERAQREKFDRYWESLTPEQRRARAERFAWKPGGLRLVRRGDEKPGVEP